VSTWAGSISNSWRTTQDITIYTNPNNTWQQMKSNFLINMKSAHAAGSGHWNDPDMLVVGNGWLTTEEEQTHFALWAFAKAPLIIGTPLDSIPQSSLAILQNK